MAQGGKNPKIAIQRNDRDGDGQVSRQEWRGSTEIFDAIDTNGDGYLTLEEFEVRFSGRKMPQKVKPRLL